MNSKFTYLEEKDTLSEWIYDQPNEEDNHAIQVYIGEETPVEAMKDCSVVTATYKLDEGVYGKIGIVGPKRTNIRIIVIKINCFLF